MPSGHTVGRSALAGALSIALLCCGQASAAPPQLQRNPNILITALGGLGLKKPLAAYNLNNSRYLWGRAVYGRVFRQNTDGEMRVAIGDLNGDGKHEIIVGPGPGFKPLIKILQAKNGKPVKQIEGIPKEFLGFNEGFLGGVFVAAGDVNNDGNDDVIVGAGAVAGQVNVFFGPDLQNQEFFFASDANFGGGVRVAAGDINGDGFDDIITGAGPGALGGHVKAFSGNGFGELHSFLPTMGRSTAASPSALNRFGILLGRCGRRFQVEVFHHGQNRSLTTR